MLQRLQQIKEMTTYLVRTPIGDSETYTNKRVFREGCPSSCVAFNIVQNLALETFLERTMDTGVKISNPTDAYGMDNPIQQKPTQRLHTKTAGLNKAPTKPATEYKLRVVGFVDDTTQTTTRKNQLEAESRMLQALAESGMKAHPDKLERLAISQEDPKKKLGKGWEDYV